MPTTKTIELFEYSELSDSAKETARQWWIEAMDSSDWEFTIDDFITIAGLMGIEVTHTSQRTMGGGMRPFPNVYFSLGYSQSDYAAFEANYSYRKGSAKAVREHAPQDTTLHGFAEKLQAAQSRCGYKATATISSNNRDGMDVEVSDAPYERDAFDKWTEDVEWPIREVMKGLASWLYDSLRAEYEYQTSEEQIAETMEANGYTFRENGKRED